MKVLLISANTEQLNMPVLPLGMAYVAASTRKAGHDVKTVNLMTQQQDMYTLIIEAFRNFSPDCVGISVRNIDDQVMEHPKFLLEPVKRVVAECRKLTGVPIVLGGAGYSIFPKHTLSYLKADMGIQGEGETAFLMLLERIEKKRDIAGIPGLFLPEGLVEPAKSSRCLDDYPIPIPDVDLPIPSEPSAHQIWIPFQTRRGCPLNCSYCSTASIEGRILRKHSIAIAIQGIRNFTKAGCHHFFFVDNTFNFPPRFAEALCDRIIADGLNIKWMCILYPYRVSSDLIEKMAKAGCSDVALGCESGSEDILRRLNKRFTADEVRRISEILQRNGIRRRGFLLLGGPGETIKTVEQSLIFMDSLNLEAVKVTLGIRIYPNTELSRIALREGRIKSEEELFFPKFYMTDGLQEGLVRTVNSWMKDRPRWMR